MPCIEGLKYYYEPRVDVIGKYSRELTIDKVLELRQEAVEKYGERLSRMVIDYSKRKDGIKITAYLYNEKHKRPYYLEPRDEMDVIHVFLWSDRQRTRKTILDISGWKKRGI